MLRRYDGAAMTAALNVLPHGWHYFQSAIFTGAATADSDFASGATVEAVGDPSEEWAESYANDVIEKAMEEGEIDWEEVKARERALPLSSDGRISRVLMVVLLEAWDEVSEDYISERGTLRPLGEIANAVAVRCGIDLPDDFADMAYLDVDRAKVLRN